MGKADHIIVLMLENRSFDHMLGFLGHPNPKFDGLKGTESCPDKAGKAIKVSKDARYAVASPDHSHAGIMQQLLQANTAAPYSPTNKGFVQNYEERSPGNGHRIMSCFDRRMIPVFSSLAEEFAVCTRWFCSVPGETWPNREFAHSGTSRGRADIVAIRYHSNAKTIYELLDAGGKTWRIYHDDTPHSWAYPALWDTPIKRNRFKPIRKLYEDIRGDQLPNYTFVEPDYGLALIGSGWGNSMHPSQAPTRDEFLGGERLISSIYNELRSNPKVFEKTVFVVTFDEHGGFYDHVPPPKTVNPDGAKWKGNFDFDLLGVRVPTLIISPWIAKHTVDETVYDHTSLIQTARTRFVPQQKPLTKRDAAAIPLALHKLLTTTLRAPNQLPVTSPLSTADGERLEQQITGATAPRALTMNAVVEGDGVDHFRTTMLALSASVGTRLALEANQKSITARGLMGVASGSGSGHDGPPSPAAVLHQFWASATEESSASVTPVESAPSPKKSAGAGKSKKGTPNVLSMSAGKAKKTTSSKALSMNASGPPTPAAGLVRSEIAGHVLDVLVPLSGTSAIKEADKLVDLGLDDEERMDLSFPFTGILRRYKPGSTSRDECAALKTVRDAIDLLHAKVL